MNILFHEICSLENCSNTGFNYAENRKYSIEINIFKDIVQYIYENKLTVKFTFDDGGISNLNASNILDEFNFKGIFFIPTYYIGKPGFLKKEDIIDLHKRGHVLGSHTHTHPLPISFLSQKKQFYEWEISKNFLEELIKDKITLAALPGGDSNVETYNILNDLGFQEIYTSYPDPKYVYKKNNLTIHGRVCVMRYHDFNFIKKLNEKNIVTFNLIFMYKLKNLIKKKFKFIFLYFTKSRKQK